jgi:hypothetical protein
MPAILACSMFRTHLDEVKWTDGKSASDEAVLGFALSIRSRTTRKIPGEDPSKRKGGSDIGVENYCVM